MDWIDMNLWGWGYEFILVVIYYGGQVSEWIEHEQLRSDLPQQ